MKKENVKKSKTKSNKGIIFATVAVVVLGAAVWAFLGGKASETQKNVCAIIEVEDYGTITVALDGQAAPETVENFVTLANDGFYNGLTFHRIMEGFMMQGGDPEGNGTGGSGKNIKGEFLANGVDNPLSPYQRRNLYGKISDV